MPSFSNSVAMASTVTPRRTDKGQLYMGETKLTVRWRDMPERMRWERVDRAEGAAGSRLAPFCDALDEPVALLGLARITYLFGGRVAEERLYGPTWNVNRPLEERIALMVERPSTAIGDLRKARQIALSQSALQSESRTGVRSRRSGARSHTRRHTPWHARARRTSASGGAVAASSL